jgi:hypothetical protein
MDIFSSWNFESFLHLFFLGNRFWRCFVNNKFFIVKIHVQLILHQLVPIRIIHVNINYKFIIDLYVDVSS